MFKKLLAAFLLSVLLGACGKRIPLMPIGDLAPNPQELQKIKLALDERKEGKHTFKALYYVTIEYGTRKERLRQVFLFETPDKLRAELLPTTSTYSLGVLIAKGNAAQFVDNNGNIINSDSARELIFDTLRYDAEPKDLIKALLGLVPEVYSVFKRDPDDFQVFSSESHYLAKLKDSDGRISAAQFLDKQDRRVVMQIEYQEYKNFGNDSYPSLLVINLPRESVKIELKLNFFQLNSAIPPKNFEFLSAGESS